MGQQIRDASETAEEAAYASKFKFSEVKVEPFRKQMVRKAMAVMEVEGMAAIQAHAVIKVCNSAIQSRGRCGRSGDLGGKYELGSLSTSTQVPYSGVAGKH